MAGTKSSSAGRSVASAHVTSGLMLKSPLQRFRGRATWYNFSMSRGSPLTEITRSRSSTTTLSQTWRKARRSSSGSPFRECATAALSTDPGMSQTIILVGNGSSLRRSRSDSAGDAYVVPPLIVPPLIIAASQPNQSRTALHSSRPTVVCWKRVRSDESGSSEERIFSLSRLVRNALCSAAAAAAPACGSSPVTSSNLTEVTTMAPETSRSITAARTASCPVFTTLHVSPSRNGSCSWPPTTKSTQPARDSSRSASIDWCVRATTAATPSARSSAANVFAVESTSSILSPRKTSLRKTPGSDVSRPSRPTRLPPGSSTTAVAGASSTAPGTLLLISVAENSPRRFRSALSPTSAS
mmetsp:Transcript_21822/g.56975  ORF Transcript_21822/g.56975 Transcript_21822/m.56975 type:complete len:355 (-) Transcript_21822:168-1232(-)